MIISEAFDVKNYCSALFCSGSTLERVSSFLKKFRRQLTSLGHAGSPCFSELLLAALHSISLGSVYLKSRLTCKNALIIPVVSWVVYTWNLQLTCKNALLIPVVSWVVYTWNLPLTCKNALIVPVVSWVVYTWNLPLTCKNALIISVVFWVVYTWNLRNMSKTSASAFFIRASRHRETDESTRLQAECFYCFEVSGTPDETQSTSFWHDDLSNEE